MNRKIRKVLIYTVIIIGLTLIARSAWSILKSADTVIEATNITIPKTDNNNVSIIRNREPGEQNIDFSDDFVGGRTNPFTPFAGAVSTVEPPAETTTTETTTTDTAPETTGTPTDNPQAATGNEYPSGDEAPDINLDEL